MTAIIFDDENDLLASLTTINPSPRLVTVDGYTGAGKTHLASKIASSLSFRHLDFDSFLVKKQGEFLAFFEFKRFAMSFNSTHQSTVLSGILMLDVLQKLGLHQELSVYVKSMSQGGLWNDDYENFDQISQIEQIANAVGQTVDDVKLDLEVSRYHYNRRPDKHANIVYNRKPDLPN